MLILSRKTNESIMIGDQIQISIVDVKGDQVKVGIKAPKTVKVYREEVYRAIQQENIEAVKAKPETLPKLDNLLQKSAKGKRDAGGGEGADRGAKRPGGGQGRDGREGMDGSIADDP